MKEINIFDYVKNIFDNFPGPGILVTTKAEDKVNSMTIGWGSVGIEWSKQIFTIYIRESRFTHELLEKNPEFVISAPTSEIDTNVKKALAICGSKSGRDANKIELAGLTVVDSESVKPPAIKELPLTLECKVLYKVKQDIKDLDSSLLQFYPETGNHSTAHFAYYGEIVKSYIIE